MEETYATSLVIEAELDDPGLQAPASGLFHMITVMRYRVLRVLRGEYTSPVIFVAHENADLDMEAFQPGVHHRLNLTSTFPETASLLSKFGNETVTEGVYYCLSFEVINQEDEE